MLKLRQMRMDIWALQEDGVQDNEAEGEGQAEEDKPEDVEILWEVLGQVGMARATVTTVYTTDTVREPSSSMADSPAGE